MFKTCVITPTPKGNYHFVGRVPESLLHVSFKTLDEAKIAAFDAMLAMGQTFPVSVQAVGEQNLLTADPAIL